MKDKMLNELLDSAKALAEDVVNAAENVDSAYSGPLLTEFAVMVLLHVFQESGPIAQICITNRVKELLDHFIAEDSQNNKLPN